MNLYKKCRFDSRTTCIATASVIVSASARTYTLCVSNQFLLYMFLTSNRTHSPLHNKHRLQNTNSLASCRSVAESHGSFSRFLLALTSRALEQSEQCILLFFFTLHFQSVCPVMYWIFTVNAVVSVCVLRVNLRTLVTPSTLPGPWKVNDLVASKM